MRTAIKEAVQLYCGILVRKGKKLFANAQYVSLKMRDMCPMHMEAIVFAVPVRLRDSWDASISPFSRPEIYAYPSQLIPRSPLLPRQSRSHSPCTTTGGSTCSSSSLPWQLMACVRAV